MGNCDRDKLCRNISLPPFAKIRTVIVSLFVCRPAIKGFAHDRSAHFIADAAHFLSRWVVSGTDSIAAHLLQEGELAAEGRGVKRRTQGPRS